jgi:hypothetical protein
LSSSGTGLWKRWILQVAEGFGLYANRTFPSDYGCGRYDSEANTERIVWENPGKKVVQPPVELKIFIAFTTVVVMNVGRETSCRAVPCERACSD